MTHPKPEHFHISVAFFCADCECIGSSSEHCAGCGSVSLLALANILNRQSEEVAIESVLFGIEKGLVRK